MMHVSGFRLALFFALVLSWAVPAPAEDVYLKAHEKKKSVGLAPWDWKECRGNSFYDPINNGSCWSCPSEAPHRTVFRVDGPTACVGTKPRTSLSCGRLGQRPCNIAESYPSCNPGLKEDFLQHKCVSNAQNTEQMCRIALQEVFAAGSTLGRATLIALAQPYGPLLQAKATAKPDRVTRDMVVAAIKEADPDFWKDTVKMLKAVRKTGDNVSSTLFAPDVLCSPDKLKDAIAKAGVGIYNNYAKGGRFYQVVSFTPKVQPILGLLPSLSIVQEIPRVPPGQVIDPGSMEARTLAGTPAVFLSLGASAQTAVSAAYVFGLQFALKQDVDEFKGWSDSVSAGVSTQESGLDLGMSLDAGLNAGTLLPYAFGGSFEVGAGVGTPVSFAFTAGYSWRLY